ncbi:MAG TPA: thiol reductant ABC exporter subunit CydD [Thiothrix sp.]|nr:thiol reductant ABC exporter subunit CydD [Thiothrix sp.]
MKPRQAAETKSLMSQLKQWKNHAGKTLSWSIGSSLTAGLLIILQAWLLALIINAVVFNDATLADVHIWLIALFALFVVRAALMWVAEQLAFQAAIKVKVHLRQKLYTHVQELGATWLNRERSGDVVNALSDGIEGLEAYYARYIPAMTIVSLLPLAILVFVFAVDWLAALILLLTAPLIPAFMILIGKGTEKRNQRQWKQLAHMSAHFLDMIQGLTSLKLFNASRREAKMVEKIADDYRQSTMSVLRVAFLSSFMLEFLASVSIALVAVSIGFRLFWGEIDFLYGLFVLLLAPEFYLPLRNMGTQYHARMEAIGAVERILEIFKQTPPQPINQSDDKTGDSEHPSGSTPSSQQIALPTGFMTQAHIELRDLHFHYPDQRQALNGVSLTIQPQETVAIVGESGAGKSTLLNVLLGFLQTQQGEIILQRADQAQGYSLYDLPKAQWYEQLAWLPQRAQIFPKTVAENIALGQAQYDLTAVQQAAKQANADEFIQSLPQGYQTMIGEGGHGLSGGQQQRIALARVFLKDVPIVLLDEATAHLDQHSEQLIQQSISLLSQQRTVIMIAHRLQTIKNADRIALMKAGQVIAVDTHESLLNTQVYYQQLYQAYYSTSSENEIISDSILLPTLTKDQK